MEQLPTVESTLQTANAVCSTSFLQTTSTLGFILALLSSSLRASLSVKLVLRAGVGAFRFCCRCLLVVVSIFIRVPLKDRPYINSFKANGQVSESPIRESFATVGH